MARVGLYKEVPSPADDVLQRIQKNIIDAVNTLTKDDDILRVPVVTMVATGNIQAGKSVVVFTGSANQTLTLPQSKAQGASVSAVLVVLNTSAVATTIIPTGGDTVNGLLTLSLAAGVAVYLTSDGVNKWLAISGPGGAAGGNIKLSAGTTSALGTSFVFSNSNNVTFGINGSTITASAAAGAANINFSAGTTSSGIGSVVFSNSNGISFGLNGSTITASQAQAFSAAGGSSVFSTLVFTNSNGVSFSNTLGSVWGSVDPIATMFATGNTTQSTTGTRNISSLIFAASGNASVGITGGSVLYSVGNQTNQQMTLFATGNTTQSSTGTTNASSLIFAASGPLSVGITGGSILYSAAAQTNQQETMFAVGNTTQSSTGTRNASSMVYVASGALSVGITGGSVLYSAPAGFTRSRFNPFEAAVGLASQIGSNTLVFHPVPDADNFQFDRMLFDITVAQTGTSGSGGLTVSMWAGIYTRNVSTLSLLASQSTSQGFTVSSTNTASQNGHRIFSMGWTTTMTQNDIWIGVVSRTTTSGTNQFGGISNYVASNVTENFSGLMGVATNTTMQNILGLGVYSATTTAIPGSVAFSQINGGTALSNRPPLYEFLSQTA
jgi:hypothetical protein